MKVRSLSLLAAAFLSGQALPASAVTGPWAVGDHFQVRLLASGMADGRPAAALEIVLDPGWKTYWRTPGESGLPTELDFTDSWNLADVSVGYPPPQRYDDGVSVSNVYEGRVVLPIEVRPAFAGAPTTLTLRVSLGVCETVCIPAEITTSLVVAAAPDPAVQSLIQVARASLPTPPQPGVQEVVSIERLPSPDDQPEFMARIVTPAPEATTVFVEGPPDWIAKPSEVAGTDGSILSVTFGFDRLSSASALEAVTITVVARGTFGPRAIEQRLDLPPPP